MYYVYYVVGNTKSTNYYYDNHWMINVGCEPSDCNTSLAFWLGADSENV